MLPKNDQLLIQAAARELEELKQRSLKASLSFASTTTTVVQQYFPPACREIVLRRIPGNQCCIDCNYPNPTWASISYGIVLCMKCCGNHRSYGVTTSKTRSIDMDHWSYEQIVAMLEGGNDQLSQFFYRHRLTNTSNTTATNRYHTKAAQFYRTHLLQHVTMIHNQTTHYQGRDAYRQRVSSSSSSSSNEQQQELEEQTPSLQTNEKRESPAAMIDHDDDSNSIPSASMTSCSSVSSTSSDSVSSIDTSSLHENQYVLSSLKPQPQRSNHQQQHRCIASVN